MNPIMDRDNEKYQNKQIILFIVLFFMGLFFCLGISYFYLNLLSIFLVALGVICMVGTCIIIKSRYTLLIACGISLVFNLIICKNFTFVLLSLVVYPISLIFYTLFTKKVSRTNIIIAISVFLAIFITIYIIFFQILSTGSFSLNSLLATISEEIEKMVVEYVNIQLEVQKRLNADLVETDINSIDSIKLIYNMKMTLLVFVPASFIIFCNFLSYLITSFAKPFFHIFFYITSLKNFTVERKSWRITLSMISVILLPMTILLSMFTSEYSSIVYICVINNINLILSPAFFIVGLYAAKDYLKENFSSNPSKCIIGIVLVVIFTFTAVQIIFYAFTVAGLISTTKKHTALLVEKVKKYIDDNNGNDDNNDND